MELKRFIENAEKYFPYLFGRFGFAAIYGEYARQFFGNCLIVLESDQCRVRIELERSWISIDIGPLAAPLGWLNDAESRWFDLPILLSFLEQKTIRPGSLYQLPEDIQEYYASIDWQLARLSGILRPYCDRLFALSKRKVSRRRISDWSCSLMLTTRRY